jgi:hypothetical protein
MMAGMRREEARSFYEEDEDPQRIFAPFDAGQKRSTRPPARRGEELRPMSELVGDLVGDLRQLRLRERIALAWKHLSTAMETRNKTH